MKKTDGECLFSDSLHFFTSFSWIFFLKKLCYGSARCWGNKIQEKSAGPDVVARLCVHNITVILDFLFSWEHWEFVILQEVIVVYQSCWWCSRNEVLQRPLQWKEGVFQPKQKGGCLLGHFPEEPGGESEQLGLLGTAALRFRFAIR